MKTIKIRPLQTPSPKQRAEITSTFPLMVQSSVNSPWKTVSSSDISKPGPCQKAHSIKCVTNTIKISSPHYIYLHFIIRSDLKAGRHFTSSEFKGVRCTGAPVLQHALQTAVQSHVMDKIRNVSILSETLVSFMCFVQYKQLQNKRHL